MLPRAALVVSRPPVNMIIVAPTCSSRVSGRPCTVPFTIADSTSSRWLPEAARSRRNSSASAAMSKNACGSPSLLIRVAMVIARWIRSALLSSRTTRARLREVKGTA